MQCFLSEYVCGHIYVTNGQNKPCRFTISFELCPLFQKLVRKVIKIETSSIKVYYIIPLNYRLTGHLEIFKIKLYYFRERLNPRYDKILHPVLETLQQM